MPLTAQFMPEEGLLSPKEYVEVVSDLCRYGLEEVRLTGGEPLMRKSFDEIADGLSKLPLKKIGMTTNAVLLDRHFENLKRNRINHLNISLDSLNEERFRKITNGNHLRRVVENIESSVKLGFSVKINVVVMRGVNDDELFDFADFSRKYGIEVRFLEVMKIGHVIEKQDHLFVPTSELIERLCERHQLSRDRREYDSTSTNFVLDNGAQIGFISSESNAFCGQCSRWRLSADGIMRACLFKNDGLSLKNKSHDERADIFQTLLGMKPYFRPKEVAHHMNGIGG